MLLVLTGIFVFVLLSLLIFASPKLSPIPYFPSNKKDIPRILEMLAISNNKIVIDFGAGDGSVVVAGASYAYSRRLDTQFIAVEINPYLLCLLHMRRLFHPNRKNIYIIRFDMFRDSIQTLVPLTPREKNHAVSITSYFYISPRYLQPMKKRLVKAAPQSTIVTYFYAMPEMVPEKIVHGIHSIYRYRLP